MEIKNLKFKESAVDVEKRTFTGYASIFGNVDFGNDIVSPGAFTQTLKERKDKIKIMYNHMYTIGKPINLEETKKGLWVEGYISKIQKGDEVLTLMADGAIDEMSFGYDVIKYEEETIKDTSVRVLKELRLWEVSPVDFAMNEMAEITAVKSIAEKRGINLDDDQIKDIIQSIQSMSKSSQTLTDESPQVLDNNILDILKRIDQKSKYYIVRKTLNG